AAGVRLRGIVGVDALAAQSGLSARAYEHLVDRVRIGNAVDTQGLRIPTGHGDGDARSGLQLDAGAVYAELAEPVRVRGTPRASGEPRGGAQSVGHGDSSL